MELFFKKGELKTDINMESCPSNDIGDYKVIRTLGSGTTGKVKLAQNKVTGDFVAIKIIKRATFVHKPNLEIKIKREIGLMRLMDHHHILKLIDVLESPRHIHMVLEYAPKGELFEYLVSNRMLKEEIALDIFRQIIFALDYIHQHSICHRDLKPENILLDQNNRVKVADFGFARYMKENIADTSCGSPHYAAPEVIRGNPYDGCAADIWSAGVILFALLAGYLPFDDPSIRNLLLKVKRGRFQMPPDFHKDIQDLISKMMNVDPSSRIRIDEIKNHVAFRFGLPRLYIVPSPIPMPNLNEPVDPSQIPQNIITSLSQIGMDQEEISLALAQYETNDIKVFVLMMTHRLLIEKLPWNQAISTLPTTQFEDYEIHFRNGVQYDEFNLTPNNLDSSMSDGYSFVSRASWFSKEPVTLFERIEHYGPALVTVPELMSRIQEILINNGFLLFHPDDMVILGQIEGENYIRFECSLKEDDTITLNVSMNGNTDLLFALVHVRLSEILPYQGL